LIAAYAIAQNLTMQTIHETILDSSSIQHAISLPHFTPSTIYPFPQPRLPQLVGTSVEIKVVGNIVVAGGSDLRVFEVREEPAFLHARAPKDDHDDEIERVPNGKHLADAEAETLNEMEDGDGFKTMGSVIVSWP
jgi:cleavage and polyadenylation specificity factor subunit 1